MEHQNKDNGECFRCPICIRLFYNKQNLFTHLMSGTSTNVFSSGHGLNSDKGRNTLVKYQQIIKALSSIDIMVEIVRLHKQLDIITAVQMTKNAIEPAKQFKQHLANVNVCDQAAENIHTELVHDKTTNLLRQNLELEKSPNCVQHGIDITKVRHCYIHLT